MPGAAGSPPFRSWLGLCPSKVDVQAGSAALESGRHSVQVDLRSHPEHVGRLPKLGCARGAMDEDVGVAERCPPVVAVVRQEVSGLSDCRQPLGCCRAV